MATKYTKLTSIQDTYQSGEGLELVEQAGEGNNLDLSGYDVKRRGLLHFKLAVGKNLRLKSRRPKGCACEILKPPFFMMVLIIGYYAADNTLEPAAEYSSNPAINTTALAKADMCVVGIPENQSFGIPECIYECKYENNVSLVTPPPDAEGWGDYPTLCSYIPLPHHHHHHHHHDDDTPSPDSPTQPPTPQPTPVPPIPNPYNFDGTNQAMTIPDYDSMVFAQKVAKIVNGPLNINTDSYQHSLIHQGCLEFVAPSCEDVTALMSHLRSRSLMFDTTFNHTIEARRKNPDCPYMWKSESSAVDYIKDDGADTTWALIVLHTVDTKNHIYDYTIRMNYTSTPYTFKKVDKFSQGLGKHRYTQYATSGFITLQTYLDEHFTLLSGQDPEQTTPGGTGIMGIPMPTWSYHSSEFFQHAGSMIPLVLSLSFLYPVSCLVGGIVEEKEHRLREGMLIMGLSKMSFYTSWFCSYWILVTISCVIITLISGTTFLAHTSWLLIFLVFELFSMSVVAMSMLISVFFSKSRIAAIAAPLLMFITVVPKFALPKNEPLNIEIFTSLLSPVAFSYSTELITNYEQSGIGSGFSDLNSDEYSYTLSMIMMVLDTVLYLALAWYLDLVLPSEFGVKRHPLFFLFPSYWCGGRKKSRRAEGPPSRMPMYVDTELDEATRAEMKGRERVRVMGLRKEFKSDETKKNIAVNNLGNGLPEGAPGGDALTFYEGQIQCVLGHNGAGKTTLINMLTGMLPPTAGDCEVWGRSILDDMDKIREDIGFCPQHNILWARLSCEEHLAFYGRLKGVPEEELWGQKGGPVGGGRIEQMLRLVNLYEKRKAWSSVLSGGQKRKLSVACSLIGGSRLVFLDEPTAGMDVESRRAMWSLLRDPNVLRGRVIVLTTHYMDEADLLGDSIAIMNKGCLHSWGSSFFLKSRLGVGYNMSVAMQEGCDPAAVEEVVQRHITRAEVGRISCTGNELRLRLPMDSRPSEEATKLIAGLPEGGASGTREGLEAARGKGPTSLREYISGAAEPVGDKTPPTAEELKVMDTVLDDIRTPKVFPAMFDELDSSKETLKIEGYGVSVTTLEEIFMKIALSADSEEDLVAGEQMTPQAKGKAPSDFNFGNLYSILGEKTGNDVPKKNFQLYTEQYFGLIKKRFNCARRDNRTLCFQFVLPVVFILIALLLGRLGPPHQPSLTIGASLYDRPADMPWARAGETTLFDNCTGVCPFDPMDYTLVDAHAVNGSVVDSATMSGWLLEDYMNHKHVQRGSAMVFPDDVEVMPPLSTGKEVAMLFTNASYMHSFPAVVNAYTNAVLKKTHVDGKITARNHPLPFSNYEQKVIDSVMVVITGIFIMIPFTFVPSNFVSFIVKERECKAKHVQVVSGVHMGAYWASSFTFDLLAYMCTMCLAFIVFFGDSRDEFVGSWETFWATFFLFLLYGISSIANSYLMSFLFNSHTAAQNAMMIFNFIAGFILVIASNILDFIDSTKDVNKYLKYFYRCIPSYCLGEGIISLSGLGVAKAVGTGHIPQPFDWDITVVDLTYMLGMTPIFVLVTCLIEIPWMRRRFLQCKWSADNLKLADEEEPLVDAVYDEDDGKLDRDSDSVVKRRGEWLVCTDDQHNVYYFNERTGESKWTEKDTPFYRDEAVEQHAREVLHGKGRKGDYVTVQRLRKVWPPAGNMAKPKVAVADLSFGVRSGELFAFLGTNGAGKTTTLSVLSGEFAPSEGRAFIGENPETGDGYDVVEEAQLARQSLGFCPQFDALLDHMTCEEHLELFACLRGIPSQHVQPSIDLLLGGLGLLPHRKKLSKALSGGNRRKLSVAVALMGGPPVVFLDEPSAGMDPVARRSLWGALEKAITELHLSVVLTTHHLEEIEGLGRLQHRVTIMVDGRLQCLGSLSQLKQSLGDSYELTVKVRDRGAEAAVRALVGRQWSEAVLTEGTQLRLTYQVRKQDSSLSAMFQFVEDNRKAGITDYSINETSLEQVFMRIGERALRDEDAEAYANTAGKQVLTPVPPEAAKEG